MNTCDRCHLQSTIKCEYFYVCTNGIVLKRTHRCNAIPRDQIVLVYRRVLDNKQTSYTQYVK